MYSQFNVLLFLCWTASVAAYFITADKTILECAKRNAQYDKTVGAAKWNEMQCNATLCWNDVYNSHILLFFLLELLWF